MLIKKLSIALFAGCFALTGCNQYVVEGNKRIEETLSRVEEYKEISQIPDLPEPTDTVRMQNDIYLGNQSIKIMEGDSLPAWLEKEDGITMAVAEDAKLADILQEISDITGMDIRLDDLRMENAIPEDAVPLKYSGSLSGLLNYLSNRYSVYWRYKDGVISFFTKETRIFTIYALPTTSTMQASLSGATMGEGGGGTSSSNLRVNAELDVWSSIEEGVKQVVAENGQLSFSKTAGTISVTASPYIVRKVAAYVANWNEKLSRQVAITVRILQVTISDDNNYGLSLNAIFDNGNISATFSTAATLGTSGLLSMALIKPDSKFKPEAIIQAFSTQGKTRLVTSSTVTTLNNKLAPIQISTSQGYVKEITVTTTGSGEDKSSEVQMDTDDLSYGFTMEVLPRILDHGRLILLFNLSITDLLELKNFTAGSNDKGSNDSSSETEGDSSEGEDDDNESEMKTVQLPTMRNRGFVQEIAMRSGQTLVLTGFEDINESTKSAGVGKAKMGILGGQAVTAMVRNVLVILVTPEVLQSPLSQEALMRDY